MNRRALLQAIRQSDLSLRDKVLLRMAVAIRPNDIEEAVTTAVEEANLPMNAVEGSVDWNALIKFFIESVLPILLQLLKK